MLTTYTLDNVKRDLSDALSTVVADRPNFISVFPMVPDATARKHEWLEDDIGGRSVTAGTVSGLAVTLGAADAAKLVQGCQVSIHDNPALFAVESISGNVATLKLLAAHGADSTEIKQGDIIDIVSTPIVEGSDKGEATARKVGSNYNITQIYRKEVTISGSAAATNVYGNIDNQIDRQTEFALQEMTRDMNRTVIRGIRQEVTAANNGTAGGLYFFGAPGDETGLYVDANGARLDSFLVNDGAQAVLGAGGNPSLILCSVGQARVISAEYKDQVQVLRADEVRGSYVASIANAVNGSLMTIISDPDMPDGNAWVIDPLGFGISALQGRGVTDSDTTPAGFDGIRRTVLAELTFEFKNARQRLCLLKNLKASSEALAAFRAN